MFSFFPSAHDGSATNYPTVYPTQYGVLGRHVKALEVRQKSLPAVHPDVATSLYNLGRVYEAQEKFAKAEPLFRQALEIFQQTLPPDSPTLGRATEKYAEIVKKLKKPARTTGRKTTRKEAVANYGKRP